MFKLKSSFSPTGDQPQAIEKLVLGVRAGLKNQVLLGVTGSGKTFIMANVIQKLKMPTLIISHNKTLAGQLYQEMRDFFPDNAVSYFVSYYDYYQPEAYIPQTDTYIEKEADINQLIDKLRLQSTTNILTRKDVIVVASVSCIYNIGSPIEYGRYTQEITINDKADWKTIAVRLVELQYDRSEFEFKRGTFRVRGNYMDIYPAYEDYAYRIVAKNNTISAINKINPLTGETSQNSKLNPSTSSGLTLSEAERVKTQNHNSKSKNINIPIKELSHLNKIIIYPAKHYLASANIFQTVEKQIRQDLLEESNALKKSGKITEAERLIRRVNYDLEMIKEVGYVNGIENYSRYFDQRQPGDAPYTLIDYFKKTYLNNFLVFIDESHMTIPQLKGMYNGDHSRKKILIDFGFRLKAAYDNRPLHFEEFFKIPPNFIYVSATPDEWELNKLKIPTSSRLKSELCGTGKIKDYYGLAEQLVRPTGVIDPKISIKPAKNEINDLITQIDKRVVNHEKILVTSLTKKIAEDLAEFLKEKNIRAEYLHSDIQTLERSNILDNLRKGEFDVLIGVNLLREGLDLPEVSLVAILDADREGFLRSKTALIQTMGRAARNISGEVIIYADIITKSIKAAIAEIQRRRNYQLEYNKKYHIEPKTIYKPIREKIVEQDTPVDNLGILLFDRSSSYFTELEKININSLTPYDNRKIVKKLEKEMKREAEELNFEMAIKIRDKIHQLKLYE